MFSHKKYRILVCAIPLQFCYGLAYIWSVFQPNIKRHFSLNDSSANLPFGILLAMFSIGNILGGLLQKKIHPVILIISGNFLMISGMVSMAFIPSDKAYFLNICYGVMGGLGAGIGYNTTIATVQKWFPNKTGLITGILVSSTGAFGIIMNPLAKYFFTNGDFRFVVLTISAIMAICLIVGSTFMRKPPETELNGTLSTKWGYTFKEVLRLPLYYQITLTMMLAVPGYMLISPMIMNLAIKRGLSEEIAVLGIMFLAIMNVFGRLVAPWLSDKYGQKRVLTVLFLIDIFAILGISILRGPLFLVSSTIVGLSYGGFMGIFPSLTTSFFGTRQNGLNYGGILLGYGITSLTCPYLVKSLSNNPIGMTLSFFIAAGAGLIGLILALNIQKPYIEESRRALA